MIEFRVLGPLEVTRAAAAVTVPSLRQRALVTRLLLSRGRVVPAEALFDAVWEHQPPRDARHALHGQVSRVRALLGPAVLVTRPPGYLLAVEAAAVDAERFEAAVARAAGMAAGDPAAAVALLDQALGWWRGAAYAEFAGGFAQPAAVRLEEARIAAREQLGEALLAAGQVDRASGELAELVADHPVRERPHGLLMRALYAGGRQTEALAVYRRFRHRLRDELGLDPSPALRELHEQVLRQQLPATPAVVTAAPPGHRSGPAPRSASMTNFVGRERELHTLTELLRGGSRLVNLVGPGGVGKTRLAREFANRLTDRTVWWADLTATQQPADVPYRLVDSVGLPQPAERELVASLVDELRIAGTAVLVADNCEHVIGSAAPILARIAASCPELTVLATSREPLAVEGEQVLAVPPLPQPELDDVQLGESPAVALFVDRLRAAGAQDLDPEQLGTAAEICRRAGGLPLAIELAAARARSLGPATVATRPALDLLTGGRRGGPDRHRSLRAVLDWSHDLLSTGERLLFRRLAIFRGWFTLDDVEQVCVDGSLAASQVADLIGGLVEKSMLAGPAPCPGSCQARPPPPPQGRPAERAEAEATDWADRDRYWLLVPMRSYAAEQLAAHGEDRWLAAAHARLFVELAERTGAGMRSGQERHWVGQLTERIDELRAVYHWAYANDADLAVRLAAALVIYARYHMRFELQDWAAAAAELPGAVDHPLRGAALGSAAEGAWARGQFDTAERLARAGLAVTPDGAPRAAGPVLVLGDIALLAGRLVDADRAYQRVLELAGDNDPHDRCEALGGRALVACYQGDQPAARGFAEAGERLAAAVGGPGLVAMARYFAGEVRLSSDPSGALELLAEAQRLAMDAGALLVAGFATVSLVSVRARAAADPVAACAAYREAIEHWRRGGNRTQQWVTLRNLVPVLVRAGHHELACEVHGALGSAPVQLPAGVAVPEAEALASAIAEARQRLGDHASQAVHERGARMSIEDLVAAVLATIDPADQLVGQEAGSSR